MKSKLTSRIWHITYFKLIKIVAAKIEGEPAAALFMKGSEKMAANARSILGSYLTSWRYIDDKKTADGGFSIRD